MNRRGSKCFKILKRRKPAILQYRRQHWTSLTSNTIGLHQLQGPGNGFGLLVYFTLIWNEKFYAGIRQFFWLVEVLPSNIWLWNPLHCNCRKFKGYLSLTASMMCKDDIRLMLLVSPRISWRKSKTGQLPGSVAGFKFEIKPKADSTQGANWLFDTSSYLWVKILNCSSQSFVGQAWHSRCVVYHQLIFEIILRTWYNNWEEIKFYHKTRPRYELMPTFLTVFQ